MGEILVADALRRGLCPCRGLNRDVVDNQKDRLT